MTEKRDPEELLSIAEAAEECGRSERGFWTLIMDGRRRQVGGGRPGGREAGQGKAAA